MLEVISPGMRDTVPIKLTVARSFGLQLKAVPTRERFVYELRVPLHTDSTAVYGLNVGRDSLFTMGIESQASEAGTNHAEHSDAGGMGGGGMGGGGMGGGHGMGGHMGGGHHHGGGAGNGGSQGSRHEPSEPFAFQVHVKLAQASH